MRRKIFLDCETTGLEPEKHEVWQIAWVEDQQPVVQERILVHSLKTADQTALEMNHYLENHPNGARSPGPMVDLELRQLLWGTTIVCANPTFDRMFLRNRWGGEPWHYRSIDVESMAFGILGYEDIKGLKDVAEDLVQRNFDIPLPDHTAAGDVHVLRACYNALRELQRRATRGDIWGTI